MWSKAIPAGICGVWSVHVGKLHHVGKAHKVPAQTDSSHGNWDIKGEREQRKLSPWSTSVTLEGHAPKTNLSFLSVMSLGDRR